MSYVLKKVKEKNQNIVGYDGMFYGFVEEEDLINRLRESYAFGIEVVRSKQEGQKLDDVWISECGLELFKDYREDLDGFKQLEDGAIFCFEILFSCSVSIVLSNSERMQGSWKGFRVSFLGEMLVVYKGGGVDSRIVGGCREIDSVR